MKNKHRILFLLFVFSSLFLVMSLYLVYFQIFESQKLVVSSYNLRNQVDETKIKRGSIFDRNGVELVRSIIDENGAHREMDSPRTYAHLIGYHSSVYGNTGLEQAYNAQLLNLKNENIIGDIIDTVKTEQKGNDLVLSIDDNLQVNSYDLLEGHKGSIVVLNAQTGDVLSMVSRPGFNANEIDELFGELNAQEDAPFLNRSTMGLYTPGSTMKIITATSMLENRIDSSYFDEGEEEIEGSTIVNFEGSSFGEIDLEEALVYSVNTYFARKALDLGAKALEKTSEEFFLNQEIPFELPTAASRVEFQEGMDQSLLAANGYGQGNLLVTPLNMALSIAGIANDGYMLKPRLISELITPSGTRIPQKDTELLSRIADVEKMKVLQQALERTALESYGLYFDDAIIGGKTGTAESDEKDETTWFVGYYKSEENIFAVAVVLEEEGGTGLASAVPIARNLFENLEEYEQRSE